MRVPPRFGAFALGLSLVSSGFPPSPILHAAPPPGAIEVARQLNEVFIEVADRCTPSVVVVQVAQKLESLSDRNDHPFLQQMPEEMREQFEEYLQRERRRRERSGPEFNGEGSGIIYREDGHILTNAHVVENAERIRVRFHDGREVEAEVRGEDRESDIAVLRLKEAVPGLRPARFGDSTKVRVGEFAIAIGAPYELEFSVTFGHISAKGRAGLSQLLMDEDFLQTDANINPGNSGGPLLNLEGEVIGVNSMIRGVGTGICFAIPANLAREVADQLVDTGRFQRSWLAIGILGLREDERLRKRFPGLTNGVCITEVPGSGPAHRARLRAEDVILSVDGHPVSSVKDLRREVSRKRPGTELSLDVVRDGKPMPFKIQTDAMPDLEQRAALFPTGPGFRSRQRPSTPDRETPAEPTDEPQPELAPAAPPAKPESHLGLLVQTADDELANRFKLSQATGVVVTGVEPDGRLAEYGFRSGDLIYEVDRKPIKTSSQFAEALKESLSRKKFTIRYQRSGQKLSAVVLNEPSSRTESR